MAISQRRFFSGAGALSWILLFLIILLLADRLWHLRSPHRDSGPDPTATARTVTPRGDLAEDEKATIEIFKNAKGSVVNITSIGVQRSPFSFEVMKIPRSEERRVGKEMR